MAKPIVIHWFRNDLRLEDNPSLCQAAAEGRVVPLYIHDPIGAGRFRMGAASKLWLHHALKSLDHSLGGKLFISTGSPREVLLRLAKEYSVEKVFWNRCFEPWQIERDIAIKKELESYGVQVTSRNAFLLWQPWEVLKADKTPYRVFTPFYRKGCLGAQSPRRPFSKPKMDLFVPSEKGVKVDSLGLLPQVPWHQKLEKLWNISERGASDRLALFIKEGISSYKKGRDFPALESVSRLSPYLHFGQISPHQVWYKVQELPEDSNRDHFCSELGWREFSYNLLYHNPELPEKNLVSKFDAFPWKEDKRGLVAWQKGLTGVPMVDAAMRELWETGFMHNRCRMIVASFLIKNLLIDWRVGQEWFWDCLFDADLANNSASWQWVAGCGADAAPFFRIFNPVTQGEKFDPEGEYIRKYIPEIAALPNKYIYAPWQASEQVLRESGVFLGKDYPYPIVDLKESRSRALSAIELTKTP